MSSDGLTICLMLQTGKRSPCLMAKCRTTGSRCPLLELGTGTDTSVNVFGCSEGARKLIVGIIAVLFL